MLLQRWRPITPVQQSTDTVRDLGSHCILGSCLRPVSRFLGSSWALLSISHETRVEVQNQEGSPTSNSVLVQRASVLRYSPTSRRTKREYVESAFSTGCNDAED